MLRTLFHIKAPRALALAWGVGLSLFLAAALSAQSSVAQDRIHVVVLHTNDIHGQVLPYEGKNRDGEPYQMGGIPRVAAFIQKTRAEVEAQGAACIVVDAGDWFQGTPEGNYDQGRLLILALGALGFDSMTVGNHEFDHGVDVLRGHLAASQVPALLANVRDAEEAYLQGTQPYKIVERGGMRVALVGLLGIDTPDITHESVRAFEFEFPGRTLARLQPEFDAAGVDWVLPVTHIGVGADRELARAHPDLPLIVGGHSHTYLREGTREGETLIVQAGSKGRGVGRVDLWFDAETKHVVESKAQVINLYDESAKQDENAEVNAICASLVELNDAFMNRVVGRTPVELERTKNRISSSPLGNWITDEMRRVGEAQVALQNRGGIRRALSAGDITRRDLFEVLPFGNHLVTVTMTGAALEECVRRALDPESHSGLEFSGMRVLVQVEGDEVQLRGIEIDGKPLRASGRYVVALNSFMAGGGDGYLESQGLTERREVRLPLREIMERALKAGIDPQVVAVNRYDVVE